MYGVTLCNNVTVAAGSVVTKSVLESKIVAGCPARIIGSWDRYGVKVKDNVMKLGNLPPEEKKKYLLEHEEKLVNR